MDVRRTLNQRCMPAGYPLFSFSPGDCHNVTVFVSASEAISTTVQDSFCVEIGMNITVDLQLGQTLGTNSIVTVNAYELGRDSCLAFSTGNLSFLAKFFL